MRAEQASGPYATSAEGVDALAPFGAKLPPRRLRWALTGVVMDRSSSGRSASCPGKRPVNSIYKIADKAGTMGIQHHTKPPAATIAHATVMAPSQPSDDWASTGVSVGET